MAWDIKRTFFFTLPYVVSLCESPRRGACARTCCTPVPCLFCVVNSCSKGTDESQGDSINFLLIITQKPSNVPTWRS